MTTPEKKKIFHETLQTSASQSDPYVPARQFDADSEFVVADPESGSDESGIDIEPVIRPGRRKKWLLMTLITAFLALVGWQSIDSLWQAYTKADWLTLGWSGFVLVLAAIGGARLVKEWFILRRLKRHFSYQTQAEAFIEQGQIGAAVPFCQSLAARYEDRAMLDAVEIWQSQVQPTHNDAEVLELFDAIVLKVQDEKATRVISRYASDSAVLVAMSPLAIADMLLVAWRSFRMVEELAKVYQIELGYWARIRMLKLILINMALAGVSEVAMDTGFDLLSTHLTSRISSRVGQGVGVGLLTARLGIQAMKLLRPIPWFPQTKLKLSSVRKQITARVLTLFNKQAEK